VAGVVQGPSGTAFDPSPQFWVDRVEGDRGSVEVVGRCFFGPICAGLIFDCIVPTRRDGGWLPSGLVACRLQVAEIRMFRRVADEIDQTVSGQLTLSGQVPAGLGCDCLLVARGARDDGWMFRDGLWRR